jgi:hypothetical protein
LAFFVDRDFDEPKDLPDDPRVYVTPCYAIENFYMTQSAFERILKNEFGISETNDDFKPTVDLYESILGDFNEASLELNAWIHLQRSNERDEGSKSQLNLDGVSFGNLFSVKINSVDKKYTIDDLVAWFPHAHHPDEDRIQEQIESFLVLKGRWTCMFRGKYLIIFLRKFLMRLVEDSNSKNNRKHFSVRSKVRLQLSGNVISELCQYAQTPDCLKIFLENRLKSRTRQLSIERIETPT